VVSARLGERDIGRLCEDALAHAQNLVVEPTKAPTGPLRDGGRRASDLTFPLPLTSGRRRRAHRNADRAGEAMPCVGSSKPTSHERVKSPQAHGGGGGPSMAFPVASNPDKTFASAVLALVQTLRAE
jgi:hypothetical protein